MPLDNSLLEGGAVSAWSTQGVSESAACLYWACVCCSSQKGRQRGIGGPRGKEEADNQRPSVQKTAPWLSARQQGPHVHSKHKYGHTYSCWHCKHLRDCYVLIAQGTPCVGQIAASNPTERARPALVYDHKSIPPESVIIHTSQLQGLLLLIHKGSLSASEEGGFRIARF